MREKLDHHISTSSIICLQEISLDWVGNLHPYFAANNYYLVTSNYGNKFNGYMGVGIAIPMAKYQLELTDITRIADTKRIMKDAKSTNVLDIVGRKLRGIDIFQSAISILGDS